MPVTRGMIEPHTLKIRENIARLPILALINSGASHNFLSEDVANKLAMNGNRGNSFWVCLRRKVEDGLLKGARN